MLSKDDLLQIGELLEPIHKKLDTIETNMVTTRDLELNNSVLSTILKVEIATVNKNLTDLAAATKAGFQEIVTQIKSKDAEQDERVEALEEHTGLVKPHKN